MNTLDCYNFDLPEELIATSALDDRSLSRLLVLQKHHELPHHDAFANIGAYLNSGDVLVLNNTKVMKARIFARKITGGRVELLLIRPLSNGRWHCLINGKGPFGPGMRVYLEHAPQETIEIIRKNEVETQVYEISCDFDLGRYLEQFGELPLPPYFRRQANAKDYESYQTVYAKIDGAVAAPTAGLHFTTNHLDALTQQGVKIAEVTLHVGPGTFLPVRTPLIADHNMHSETFFLGEQTADILNNAKENNHRIIAVGTTSMRVLETVMTLAHGTQGSRYFPCNGQTKLFITPGYKFLGCDALITNFHLPKSTLLMLVSAVAGRERILRAYQEAIARGYRFFSYGDACYLEICQ